MVEIYKQPFWRTSSREMLWTDSDDAELRNYFGIEYGIESRQAILDLLNAQMQRNAYHPVRKYLEKLEWDGKPRVETLFIEFLGVQDNAYTREVTRKWLIAGIKRIYEPGCKFDEMIVLTGSQGVGKSTVARKLAGNWFNESLNTFKGDESLKKLRNSWICEIAELGAFGKSTVEEIKAFISATIDVYRPSYGRNPVQYPREVIFIGTTNRDTFLRDQSGNRRFMPMVTNGYAKTKSPFEDLTNEYVNQIWAEAKKYYFDGETLNYSEEVKEIAKKMQADHTEDDGMKGEIIEFLQRKLPVEYNNFSKQERIEWFNYDVSKSTNTIVRDRICAREIWFEMLGNKHEPSNADVRKINDILNNLDFLEKHSNSIRFGKDYGKQKGYLINWDNFDVENY